MSNKNIDDLNQMFRRQLAESEDERIFSMLLRQAAGSCREPSHAGYKKPRKECPHPECIVRSTLEE